MEQHGVEGRAARRHTLDELQSIDLASYVLFIHHVVPGTSRGTG